MHMHPRKERTLVLLKPDALQRSLIGEILGRFERVGLKIVAMKFVRATTDQCWSHYHKEEEWFLRKGKGIAENRVSLGLPVDKPEIEYGRDIIKAVVEFMTAAPIVALVLEGNQSVAVVKKLVGGTEPTTSDVGTIRGDYTLDSYYLCDVDGSRGMRNLVHCTDGDQVEAQREIDIWFTPSELLDYRLVQDTILYDVNLDGLME